MLKSTGEEEEEEEGEVVRVRVMPRAAEMIEDADAGGATEDREKAEEEEKEEEEEEGRRGTMSCHPVIVSGRRDGGGRLPGKG